MDKQKALRALRCLVLLPVALVLTGGDFISISDIPSSFDENLAFGQRITQVRIEGNQDTREDVILAAMASKVGEVYTQESALLDRKWISQLGVFTSMFFSTVETGDGVTLVVTVTEVNKYTPAPVIKITDENGVSIGARMSSGNLFGSATKASAYFTVGGATNVGVRLIDPWVPGKSWWLGYRLDYAHSERRNELYDFDESSDDLLLQLTRNITNELRWGAQVMYLAVKSDTPGITLSANNRDHIPALGLFMQRDSRNLPVYPTQGGWLGVNIKKYGLGGVDTDYWQLGLDLRRYFQLGSPRNSVALYSMATFSSGQVGVDIPVYMQFNLGGANSVRGWGLGSRDGKNQFINTLEYWHVLLPYKRVKVWFLKMAMGLQAGVFGDVGTAWSEGEEFHQNWIAGGGAGLRLLMPAAVMFRFDVAAGDEGAKVEFFIASREKAAAQLDRVR
jgi:outer membrane protein assembly factor BamA